MATVKHKVLYYVAVATVAFLVGFFWPQPQPTPPNQIPWNSNDPLEWGDFQGTPDPSSPHHAVTALYLGVENVGYRTFPSEDGCVFTLTSADVDAYVDRSQSWVRGGSSSAGLLAHEQGHAYILFIHARMLQQLLAQLIGRPHPCDPDPGAQADALVDPTLAAVTQQMNDMNAQYDAETDHGRNDQEQYRWNRQISDTMMPPPPTVILP